MLIPNQSEKSSLDVFLEVEETFENFIDILSMSVNNISHTMHRSQWADRHKGSILRIFAGGPQLTDTDIMKWMASHDGLSRGICVAFFAFWYHYHNDFPQSFLDQFTPQLNNTDITFEERLLAECLLHNFCNKQELHIIFPSLSLAAYEDRPTNNGYPLIIGQEMLSNICRHASATEIIAVSIFNNTIRPAVQKLLAGKNDVWLVHSSERRYNNSEIYPPTMLHQHSREDAPEYWPADYCELPFKPEQPSQHSPYGLIQFAKIRNISPYDENPLQNTVSPCVRLRPEHNTTTQYDTKPHLPIDYIPILEKSGLCDSTFISADHPCIKGEIPLSEWLFLYDDNRHYTGPSAGELAHIGRQKLHRDWAFLKRSGGIINVHLANKVLDVTSKIISLLRILRT